MKTLAIFSIAFLVFIPAATAAASLKIVGSKISISGTRYVLYEKCSTTSRITTYTSPSALMSSQEVTPLGYTNVCGWDGTVNANCDYIQCKFSDLPGIWTFHVSTPGASTCDVDKDQATFSNGIVIPLACCP